MNRKSELIRSIDEVEKMIEDLEKMRWLLEKHLDSSGPKVREVYNNVGAEIEKKSLIKERLKYALALVEQEENENPP